VVVLCSQEEISAGRHLRTAKTAAIIQDHGVDSSSVTIDQYSPAMRFIQGISWDQADRATYRNGEVIVQKGERIEVSNESAPVNQRIESNQQQL